MCLIKGNESEGEGRGGKTRQCVAVFNFVVKFRSTSNRGNRARMNRADAGKSDHSLGARDNEERPRRKEWEAN